MLESPLTAKQMVIFRLIYETARDKGYQPTFREICVATGLALSTNGVACHVRALVKKGYVRWPGKMARHIVFLRRPDGSLFQGFMDK